MNNLNIKNLLASVIGILIPLLPFIGNNAQGAVERAVTVPRADMDKLCQGMSAEDKAEAYELGQKFADAFSDLAVFVASRGKIQPD